MRKQLCTPVLVVGGSGNIGSAICDKLLRENHDVIIADLVPPPSCQLRLHKKTSTVYRKFDLCSQSSTRLLKDYINTKSAGLSGVVTVAGLADPGEWTEFLPPAGIISKTIHLHLTSIICLLHELDSVLLPNASIILISSINAVGSFGLPAYSAAKSGLLGFVKATAKAYGERGIRINSILPGTIVTTATLKEPKNFGKLKDKTLLKEFATANDVAKLAYTLIADVTSITGQAIILDAGQSIARS